MVCGEYELNKQKAPSDEGAFCLFFKQFIDTVHNGIADFFQAAPLQLCSVGVAEVGLMGVIIVARCLGKVANVAVGHMGDVGERRFGAELDIKAAVGERLTGHTHNGDVADAEDLNGVGEEGVTLPQQPLSTAGISFMPIIFCTRSDQVPHQSGDTA